MELNPAVRFNDKEVLDFLIKHQDKGKTIERFLIPWPSLNEILKRNGVKIPRPRRYKLVEENFLAKIDQAWKAYYLGFFCADGGVLKSRVLNLAINDKDILEKLNRKIYVDRPLLVNLGKKSNFKINKEHFLRYKINISNREIAETVKRMGIPERKSLTLEFPKIFEGSKFLGDFIRGYFDGDGCLVKDSNRSGAYLVSICVSLPFGLKLQEILKKFEIGSRITTTKSKIYSLKIGKRNSLIKFYDLIYSKDTDFFLERKRVIFDEFYKNNPALKKRRQKGVYFNKVSKTWYAVYWFKDSNNVEIHKHIGTFDTEDECIIAYKNYVSQMERKAA